MLWLAVATSSLGNGMRWVALPLLALTQTDDPRLISLVSVAEQAPWLLVGLFAGVLADRYDRRRLILAGDLARAALVAAFAVAVALHATPLAVIAALGFLLTCGETVAEAAASALLPALVPRAARPAANGRLQAGIEVTDSLIGTSAGAALFGLVAFLPFALDAVTFLASAVFIALLRVPPVAAAGSAGPDQRDGARAGADRPEPHPGRSVRADILDGLRVLWRRRELRGLCLLQAATHTAFTGVLAILVLYTARVLGLRPAEFGLLVAAFAVGGVTGGLSAGRLAAWWGARRCLLTAVAGTSVATAAFAVASKSLAADIVACLLGITSTLAGALTATLRQNLVPDAYLGRVSSAFRLVSFGAGPAGALAAGFLAHSYGLRSPFLAAAALIAVGLLGCAPLIIRRPPPGRDDRNSTGQEVAGPGVGIRATG